MATPFNAAQRNAFCLHGRFVVALFRPVTGVADDVKRAAVAQLDLRGNEYVTEETFDQLPVLPNLKSLDLSQTALQSRQVEQLARRSPGLESINLSGLPLVGGVTCLRQLKALRHVDLSRTKVSNFVVEDLLTLEHLQSVNLTGSRLTDAAFARLRRERPKLKIEGLPPAKPGE